MAAFVADDGFVDEAFPPSDVSLHGPPPGHRPGRELPADVWVRAPELLRAGAEEEEVELFAKIEPSDIEQGSLGNCWLMAVFACVAEFPTLVHGLFRGDHALSSSGKYVVELYVIDGGNGGGWTPVEVDDYIPAAHRHGNPLPVFSQPSGGELWVLILEKAVAKLAGSYAALVSGSAAWAMQTLLGPPSVSGFTREDGLWIRQSLVREGLHARREDGAIELGAVFMRGAEDDARDAERMSDDDFRDAVG